MKFTLPRMLLGDKIEEYEIDRRGNTHRNDKKYIQNFGQETGGEETA